MLLTNCHLKKNQEADNGLGTHENVSETIYGQGETVNGKKEGIWKFYHDNGKLAAEIPYAMGQEDGYAIYYYESGVKESTTNWVNGVENGEAFHYYENGKIKDHGFYKNGKQHEVFTFYLESGNLELIHYFQDGIKYKEELFHPEKETKSIVVAFDGNGKVKQMEMYYDSGEKYGELSNENGKEVFSKFYYKNGILKAVMENSKWTTFDESGKEAEGLYEFKDLMKQLVGAENYAGH